MSTAKTNLKRRISRFNKAYPHLAIEVTDVSTKRQFNVAERQLTKAQAKAKFEKAKARTLSLALEYGVKVNASKIRGAKTLERAKQSVNTVRSFSIAQKKFVERVTKYNNAVHNGDINKDGDKLFLLPRTKKELSQAKRLLTKLEKGNTAAVRKELAVPEKKRISTYSAKLDKEQADAANAPTLQEFRYWQLSIREAETSPYSALGQLFKSIGWRGVNELASLGFTIGDFAESQTDSQDYPEEYIRDTLVAYLDSMSQATKVKVMSFLKDN